MLPLLLLACCFGTISAQNTSLPTHHKWEGFLEEAMLPVNLVIDTYNLDGRDTLMPCLYSPMQTHNGLFPSAWSYRNDTLFYYSKDLQAKLTLIYNPADSSFNGTFRQGTLHTAIKFAPCDTFSSFNRPQEPQPPYHFFSREVFLQRKDKEGRTVVLTGTLSLPLSADSLPQAKYPAVLLVSGSGQQDRNEEICNHKPFLVIADYFAQRGIAVLRYDDRGTGHSVGEVATATTLDFADDAEALFNYLRKQPHIDSKRVGILGHSEGGMIAPMIAARNHKVDFVVMMAGPGCSGGEILLQQNRAICEAQSLPDSLIDRRIQCMQDFFNAMDTLSSSNYFLPFSRMIASHTEGLTAEQKTAVGLRTKDAYDWAQQMQMPWMQTFIKLNPAIYLPRVKCPILALNGSRDLQVLATPNLDAIQRLASHSSALQVKLMPNLNHLFQHCETGLMRDYIYIEETIAPEALQTMADWVLQQN